MTNYIENVNSDGSFNKINKIGIIHRIILGQDALIISEPSLLQPTNYDS